MWLHIFGCTTRYPTTKVAPDTCTVLFQMPFAGLGSDDLGRLGVTRTQQGDWREQWFCLPRLQSLLSVVGLFADCSSMSVSITLATCWMVPRAVLLGRITSCFEWLEMWIFTKGLWELFISKIPSSTLRCLKAMFTSAGS